MTAHQPTLHMFCGKIAAGKSTLARNLAVSENAVLLIEDDWLGQLYGDEIKTPRDFLRSSARLRQALAPHIQDLLARSLSVVLDFQANTVESRAWMRSVLAGTGAAHCLHVLTPPDAVCLDRLRARNASGDHPFAPTEAQFVELAKHITLPGPEEGFTIKRYETAV